LFEAGVGSEIRRDLMHKCNLHTILRLPTGIFYAQGVKTNVLFFSKGTAKNPEQEENCTAAVWVYDLRSNMPSFGKRNPFGEQHLQPFEQVYGHHADGSSPRTEGEWSFTNNPPLPVGEGRGEGKNPQQATQIQETHAHYHPNLDTSRWRCFSRDWIRLQKGDSLDIAWIKDEASVDADKLPDPELLAAEAMGELSEAMRELDGLMRALGAGDEADAQRKLLVDSLGLESRA
jgi:type I restriction enzyme M protein